MTHTFFAGQITISGSAAQFPSANGVLATIKGHPDNTGNVYVGPEGVTTLTGFPLAAGEAIVIAIEGNISILYADADVNNEKICWVISDA